MARVIFSFEGGRDQHGHVRGGTLSEIGAGPNGLLATSIFHLLRESGKAIGPEVTKRFPDTHRRTKPECRAVQAASNLRLF
jgi:hypothetical protein